MATARLDRKQKRVIKEENTYHSGSKTRVEVGNQRSRWLKVEKRGERGYPIKQHHEPLRQESEEGERSAKQREKGMKSAEIGAKLT